MHNTFISDISKKEYTIDKRTNGKNIQENLLQFIQSTYPHFEQDSALSLDELNAFREQYIFHLMKNELGQLSELESKVLHSMQEHSLITKRADQDETNDLYIGQRIADKVASFGGSWTFILSFLFLLLMWILANVWWLKNNGFDPYPFILLNLILSCIAALQAPIIMMSQNRQEEKDRVRAKKDYLINLKAELELRLLHQKIDHMIKHQQNELLEIQRIQIEIMNDILNRMEKKSTP